MALPMIARDEMDQTASYSSNTSSFSNSIGGTLRRSLRQINPFKTRLFRLPATPRLARAKKGLSRGEESTNWNFERPLSTCAGGSISVGRHNGQMYTSVMSTSTRPVDSLSATPDSLSMTVPPDSPAHLRHLKPPNGEIGGSCRVRTTRHTRPPLPSYNPPNAKEAEEMIHEHIHNLMISSPRPLKRQQFLFLPETSYANNGEIYEANWKRDGQYHYQPSSPTHSTVSLLNTGRPTARSMSYGAKDEPIHRPTYHLNGLVHQPSLRSLIPSNEIHNLANFNNTENQLLFSFSDFAPDNAEAVFLGREWVFKEIHQSVISEQNPITLIRGNAGSGKSSILKQLALHSSFYSNKSNADTVDSGIVIGSQNSAESTISARNYEWLQILGKTVGAYHECHLYSANTCSIPEFVRNLATHLMNVTSLRAYSNLIQANKELLNLVRNETSALLHSPIDLFRRLIVEPLNKIDENKQPDCLLIVVDAIDEAEFHRNENGESLAWLVKTCHKELPNWVRWILSTSNENSLPFASSEARSIRIDNDVELDERVARDIRLLIDYRIAVNPELGRCLRERSNPPSIMALAEFVDEIIKRAKGNALFVSILMDMIEQERIQIKNTALSLLPTELSQIYLLYFNCIFNSLQQFNSASAILSVILASLRPLTFENIYQILNSTQTETQVSIKDLEKRLLILQPFITKLNCGSYVLIHNSLREWLLNGSNHTDYLVNVRFGHILHALNFVNQSDLTTENIYELGHHLLKANPHKYMPFEMAPGLPTGRDSQVQWLQKAAGHRLQLALLFERNIYYPNSKVSRLLLMAGASSNSILPDKDPLICKYASAGNNTLIQLLIQYGASVNVANQRTGLTPLMYAVKGNHLQTVELLLQCDPDIISTRDRDGNSALVHAAEANSNELFALLFDTEWPNEDRHEEIQRSFQAAIQTGNINLCKYILDKTETPMDLSTSLLAACCSKSEKSIEVIQFLLLHGATLKLEQKWRGKSALLCSVQSGLYELTKSLLDNPNLKINTEVSTDKGWNALIVAAHYGRIGLIQELIDRGCFIDAADLDGCTAIGHAINNEHFAIATLLIKNGCNVHVTDNEGNTLLHYLSRHHNKALIERLIELGLQVDAKNSNGLRPVELAIMSGNKQNSAEILLRRGARLRHITWQIAAKNNPEYVVCLIEKLFNDGRTLHRRGRTPEALQRFHHALQKCNEFLQEEGCSRFLNQMNTSIKSIDSLNNNSYNSPSLVSIRPQLRYLNCQILFALTNIQLHDGAYDHALEYSTEALNYADSEASLFQLHSLRARIFFDSRDVKNALIAAQLAASLRPENKDIQVMLSTLNPTMEF